LRIDYYIHFASEGRIVRLLDHLINLILITGEQTMATFAELKDAIAQLKQDIVAEKTEIQTALADLKEQVRLLTEQLGNGGVITQDDLNGLALSIAEISASVKDISEPDATP